ncbi:MAG: threonine--tRNA ligase, partial [Proteobacteria bacterium]|nr:threonine--tRNA ligase [Pseudomonadota bacterium]
DAIAAKLNGKLVDITTKIEENAKVEIITTKQQEAIEILRHDCEHLLAQAVKELFPETEVIFGTSGKSEKSPEEFFYDFRREKPFTESDLPKIEKKMLELASKNLEITRAVKPKEEAIEFFKSIGEPFKAQIIEDIIPQGEEISLYTQGNFTDLCKGPHYINTKFLRNFKLLKVSGSYWRGDSSVWQFCIHPEDDGYQWRQFHGSLFKKSDAFAILEECYKDAKANGFNGSSDDLQDLETEVVAVIKVPPITLQRITGTAFFKKQELEDYLHILEEAQRRDHRKIGKDLSLFHISDEAVGSIFWHKNGWYVYRTIQEYIRKKQEGYGYEEVRTPQLINKELWEKSGHWEKYQENMFICRDEDGENASVLALKPMNCPAHIEIFKQGLKSYKDLPIRMAEFGSCHRNEPSGALHGIMRVRAFTQDDAHIFCTEEQVVDEVKSFCLFLHEVYKDFGFKKVDIKLSTRPEKRAGSNETWDRAEQGLAKATRLAGYEFETLEGEGAFYGPKLEFQLTDALGRKWQCGTIQLDYVLPERLGAYYISSDGSKKQTTMLHRAILGSFERFIGILIENFAGKLPLWVAPVHVAVCSISQNHHAFAQKVGAELQTQGIITHIDDTDDKISYKIRKHSHQKVPYIITIGKQEEETGNLSVRILGSEQNHQFSIERFKQFVIDKIKNKEIGYE